MATYLMPGGDPASRIQMGMRRTVLAGRVTSPEDRAAQLEEIRRKRVATEQARESVLAGDRAAEARFQRARSPSPMVRPGGTTDAYPWMSDEERDLADLGAPLAAISPTGSEAFLGVGPNRFSPPPMPAGARGALLAGGARTGMRSPEEEARIREEGRWSPEVLQGIAGEGLRNEVLAGKAAQARAGMAANRNVMPNQGLTMAGTPAAAPAPAMPSVATDVHVPQGAAGFIVDGHYIGSGGAGPEVARQKAREGQLLRGLIGPGEEPLSPAQFSERTLGFSGDTLRENIGRRNRGLAPVGSQGELDVARAGQRAGVAEAGLRTAGARATAPLAPRAAEAGVAGQEAEAKGLQAQADMQGALAAGMRAMPADKVAQVVLGIDPGAARGREAEIATTTAQAANEMRATDPEGAAFLDAVARAHAQAGLPAGMMIEIPSQGVLERVFRWMNRNLGFGKWIIGTLPATPAPRVVQAPAGLPGAGAGGAGAGGPSRPATREDVQTVIEQYKSALGRVPSEDEVRQALARRGLFEPVPGAGIVQPQATLSVRG